jgi:formate dehydrogenase subunit gamma
MPECAMDDRRRTARDAARDLDIVRDLVAASPATQDALLPLLHQVQRRLGFVPDDAIRLIASALNLSRAEVQGVVSFYHDFHQHPTADHVVQLCMAEACQAVGCRELAAHAKDALGVDFHAATADGRVQLEPAYCFGNCAAGPAIRVDDRVYGRVSAERFDALITALEDGAPR